MVYMYEYKHIPAELVRQNQAACMSPEPERQTAGSGRRHHAPRDRRTLH